MSSGYYPLDPAREGRQLFEIAGQLEALLHGSVLPKSWANEVSEDAACDACFETYLELALELIKRCLAD